MRRLNLAGRRFGRLTAIARLGLMAKWICQCQCGNIVTVRTGHLREKRVSCGCLTGGLTHAQAINGGRSAEYRAWEAMKQRCFNPRNPAFQDYGGRGITVCDRWLDPLLFLSDMGPKPSPHHSLDRSNNERGYEPSNCRWATRSEQMLNRRRKRIGPLPRDGNFFSRHPVGLA